MPDELDHRIRTALLAEAADLPLNVTERVVVERIGRGRGILRVAAYALAGASALLVVGIALVLGLGHVQIGPFGWSSGANVPSATEIPIGGPRAAVVRENLDAARQFMPGGLVEPGWLPAGVVLTNAEYDRPGTTGPIDSVDLSYAGPGSGATGQVHIWQTVARDLGAKDPVGVGASVPLGGATWSLLTSPGRLALSTRTADGRTISLDGNLARDAMERIAASLVVRSPGRS